MTLQISCHRSLTLKEQFQFVRSVFEHGELARSEHLAALTVARRGYAYPDWGNRFLILEAESAEWRGENGAIDGLLPTQLLTALGGVGDSDQLVESLAILGVAHTHLLRYDQAEAELSRAADICETSVTQACSAVLRAKGTLAEAQGQYDRDYQFNLKSRSLAQKFNRPWDESVSLMNLGVACLLEEKFDEARDWLSAADRVASTLQAEDLLVNIRGNLGWALYKTGEPDEALKIFEEAESGARALGDTDAEIAWTTTAGEVLRNLGRFGPASDHYTKALGLSKELGSEEGIVNCLVSLAQVSIDAARPDDAESYVAQATPILRRNGNQLDGEFLALARARIASASRRNSVAESLLREVESSSQERSSLRFETEHELANLYAEEDKDNDAEGAFRNSVGDFEHARGELERDESKLPFGANGERIYDDYIDFLVSRGRGDEALLWADQSRARTLAQGLAQGPTQRLGQARVAAVGMDPRAVARRAGAVLLFYWLGEKQSYLWAVTPEKTRLFPLPAKALIVPQVERYRKALLGMEDPLAGGNADGQALWQTLVSPAAAVLDGQPGKGHNIGKDRPVMILADGPLSELNFETLIAPGDTTGKRDNPHAHYWIEDATIESAPSLTMLADGLSTAKPENGTNGRLLLMGDAVSASEDFPKLKYARLEMTKVQSHFPARQAVVIDRERATPQGYVTSDPGRFAYLHFVTHGTASRTDPLDSAIILSKPAGTTPGEDTYKLYAREIVQHRIAARLVTISACNGSGVRAYAGEGLVGLSWAFLRAGAQNAIGALWEASDESTPGLMGDLYAGLEARQSPASALRAAKLKLLHSTGRSHGAFYWAPFQLYTRL